MNSTGWRIQDKNTKPIRKDTYTSMSVALLTITKKWKNPSMEWIKMWYKHTMEYYSVINNNLKRSCHLLQHELTCRILY